MKIEYFPHLPKPKNIRPKTQAIKKYHNFAKGHDRNEYPFLESKSYLT